MYARISALLCILSVSAAAASSLTTGGSEVELYLKSDGGISPTVFSEMKSELRVLTQDTGLHIDWWTAKNRPAGVEGDLMVIDLRGACQPPAPGAELPPAPNAVALASTAVADGHVLPFSWVDCTAVNEFLSTSLSALPSPQREQVYGRTLARLLAHELYHVMTGTEHAETGVAKPQFSVADLLAARFEFDHVTLSKPRPLNQPSPVWQVFQDLDAGK